MLASLGTEKGTQQTCLLHQSSIPPVLKLWTTKKFYFCLEYTVKCPIFGKNRFGWYILFLKFSQNYISQIANPVLTNVYSENRTLDRIYQAKVEFICLLIIT